MTNECKMNSIVLLKVFLPSYHLVWGFWLFVFVFIFPYRSFACMLYFTMSCFYEFCLCVYFLCFHSVLFLFYSGFFVWFCFLKKEREKAWNLVDGEGGEVLGGVGGGKAMMRNTVWKKKFNEKSSLLENYLGERKIFLCTHKKHRLVWL